MNDHAADELESLTATSWELFVLGYKYGVDRYGEPDDVFRIRVQDAIVADRDARLPPRAEAAELKRRAQARYVQEHAPAFVSALLASGYPPASAALKAVAAAGALWQALHEHASELEGGEE